jgi:hypothetical protein
MEEMTLLSTTECTAIYGGENWIDKITDKIQYVRGTIDGFWQGIFQAEANRVATAYNAAAVIAYK